MNGIPQPKYINLDYVFYKIFEGISSLRNLPEKILDFLRWLEQYDIRMISLVISIVFFAGIFFVLIKIFGLRKNKFTIFVESVPQEEIPDERRTRWQNIKDRIESVNPAEWRIAIIEADSIIEEIIKRIGYEGENLGDRLKKIEPSDFYSLDEVWEAHKIRNRIAHEGDMFKLTKEEAEKVISMYEKALKELKYI